MTKLSKAECLELGKKYIETHQKYPAAKRWNIASAGCSKDRIYENWGSWIDFIKDLRLLISEPDAKYTPIHDEDYCINTVALYIEKHRVFPKANQFLVRNNLPSIETIHKVFGSYQDFKKLFDEEPQFEGYNLQEALLAAFKANYVIPTTMEMTPSQFIEEIQKPKALAHIKSESSRISVIRSILADKTDTSKYVSFLLSKISMKLCHSCNRVLEYKDFSINSSNSKGIATACKDCMRDFNKSIMPKISAKRRAAQLQAIPKWANTAKINEFYKECPKGHHVDHIIPLQGKYVCGLHVENNLQYLTSSENSSKSNYHESEEWWK